MTIQKLAADIIILATAINAIGYQVGAPEGDAVSYLARQIDELALCIRETDGMEKVTAVTTDEINERAMAAVN